jgi:hypothetical protein
MSVECENCAKTCVFLLTCPDSDPTAISYHTHLYRYGRFSKSIRPDEVGACQLRALPLLGYHDKTCALCRDVASFLNTDTLHRAIFFVLVSLRRM